VLPRQVSSRASSYSSSSLPGGAAATPYPVPSTSYLVPTSYPVPSTSYLVPTACSHALPGTKFSLMSFQTMADVLVSRRFFTEQVKPQRPLRRKPSRLCPETSCHGLDFCVYTSHCPLTCPKKSSAC
jgi:hypothetical protein